MLYHMPALVQRGSVWIYRREVPPKLRALIGKREIKESLRTTDERVAQRRWRVVHERVTQMFAEAPDGMEAWSQVVERGYEGLVAKDERSPYEAGPTKRWLKVKQKNWTVEEDRWQRRIFVK
jgi:ATP-dependent DNA ligase